MLKIIKRSVADIGNIKNSLDWDRQITKQISLFYLTDRQVIHYLRGWHMITEGRNVTFYVRRDEQKNLWALRLWGGRRDATI